MYNDQIMFMYLVFSMYFIANSRPVLGSIFFTLAYSVKAGTLLMLPAYLGSCQYFYGTRTLLVCTAIIISFQIVIALPFVLGESSVMDYIVRSKLLGHGR